ncbi:bromodomain-containing protein 8 [Astyanax mexicanus]|uniref:Bromodomain-containing protein 8 n=1 Tax=Astyanax mexicanus TaxID=7994 RepID=A0A8T2L3F7_ASTMX|nr:bromodomain-containing protein 8 [Astyanax mexicanus]
MTANEHKLLLGPTEPWSIREKLCLASSVMKSGDQNWVSVSRAIKPFAEPGRPPDWFSQKHCASQYSELLECTEAPKRKRGEKGEVVETVEDVIVRRLTAERIEELKKLIKDTQEKHRKLKREAELIQAGHLDSRLDELWGDIVQNRKQEEEEAEVKRKATDAAYQARQAVRNTPKRLSGVTMRSPSGSASPGLDFTLGDSSEDLGTAAPGAGSAVFTPVAELAGAGLVEVGLSSLLEDCSNQKKLLGQKTTPPPSPLLSELLKKGSLLSASPRLVADGEAPTGQVAGCQESQLTASALPASQAVTGAPTLSRLLEAGPTQFPSQLGSLAPAESASRAAPPAAAVAPPVDTPASLDTAGEDDGHSVSVESKASMLEEEDLVTVSYMADELDLETVGDIIAIIEDKGDGNAEALDAAAVEAALSLCEDTGHTLSGHWEAGSFKPVGPESSSTVCAESLVVPSLHPALEGRAEGVGVRHEPCGSSEGCGQGYPMPSSSSSSSSSSCCPSGELKHAQMTGVHSELKPEPGHTGKEEGQHTASPPAAVKSESVEWPQSQIGSHTDNDSAARQHSKKEVKEEEEEEDEGVSDAEEGSVLEAKAGLAGDGGEECGGDEEGEGVEGYLSEAEGETELEPPASESEDGCSMHTASSSLQLHTTADSIPSSPASSQFSISSEDQEAIQAQKIWKKAIMLVWRAAANHRYANVFLQPVTDDIAPGYHSIVHRPMDLSTIKKNIENGLIRTTAEFQRDIMLMFQNAVMYNSSDHDVFHMAVEMQRDVLEQIQQFLATQLIMQTSESGISAKSLRGREANRKQDPNDKDSVPMASPAFLLSLFDGGTRGRRCAIEADLKMKK